MYDLLYQTSILRKHANVLQNILSKDITKGNTVILLLLAITNVSKR